MGTTQFRVRFMISFCLKLIIPCCPTICIISTGRLDASEPGQCPPEGNLPDAEAGDDGQFGWDSGTVVTKDPKAEGHLRKVFYRMGFDDEGIVALSGAHTFGRAYKDRSGLGKEKTKFTDGESELAKQIRADGSEAKYTPGGSAWTDQWLVFDNSYFKILEVRCHWLGCASTTCLSHTQSFVLCVVSCLLPHNVIIFWLVLLHRTKVWTMSY